MKIIVSGSRNAKSQTLQQMCDDMVYADVLNGSLVNGEVVVGRIDGFTIIESPPLPAKAPRHDYWNQFKRKKYP